MWFSALLGTWGDDDDDGNAFEDRDWMEYWRLLFKKITIADIQKYEKEYKGRAILFNHPYV